eukprot:1016954-Rhodomonas_salina.2
MGGYTTTRRALRTAFPQLRSASIYAGSAVIDAIYGCESRVYGCNAAVCGCFTRYYGGARMLQPNTQPSMTYS